MRFVLASSSPRRKELLTSIGLEFDVHPSHAPEIRNDGESPRDYVTRLSLEKAGTIAKEHHDSWIIAADTVVVLGDMVLEKPEDDRDAARMLALIAGTTHVVHTGLTLLNRSMEYAGTRAVESMVTLLPLTAQDIQWYVATGEPNDKAGAYAVQGVGAMFIESIRGSYTNVVGLPLATLFLMLRDAGLDPLRQ